MAGGVLGEEVLGGCGHDSRREERARAILFSQVGRAAPPCEGFLRRAAAWKMWVAGWCSSGYPVTAAVFSQTFDILLVSSSRGREGADLTGRAEIDLQRTR
jgi:hypothetical protein